MALMIRGRSPWGVRPNTLWDELWRLPDLWEAGESSLRPLAADVYETEEEVIVEMAIPGLKPEDISINVTGDTLSVTGKSQSEQEDKKRNYFQKQLYYGSFAGSVSLPNSVQADKAEAHFNHGILKVVLPKAEEVKPRKIEIKSKGE